MMGLRGGAGITDTVTRHPGKIHCLLLEQEEKNIWENIWKNPPRKSKVRCSTRL
jgi:hypothetical protein